MVSKKENNKIYQILKEYQKEEWFYRDLTDYITLYVIDNLLNSMENTELRKKLKKILDEFE